MESPWNETEIQEPLLGLDMEFREIMRRVGGLEKSSSIAWNPVAVLSASLAYLTYIIYNSAPTAVLSFYPQNFAKTFRLLRTTFHLAHTSLSLTSPAPPYETPNLKIASIFALSLS